MNVKIDQYGFIYIQRGIMWRPQICRDTPRAQVECRDTCPLFHENSLEKNKVNFTCGGYATVMHDVIEDERMRRKDKEA